MNNERKKIEKRLDKLLRQIVIERDKRCVTCGSDSAILQCGHLITRNCKSVKYDLFNVACQCRNCNFKHEYYPQHYFNWFVKKYGEEELERLTQRSNQIKKYSISELETLEIVLTELLKLFFLTTEPGKGVNK